MKLEKKYFVESNVVWLSKDLIGKILFFDSPLGLQAGLITETEAYEGITDKASHAFGGRKTKRTETMFKEGGRSYVYLCYGIHQMLNIVTSAANIPHAILIRGLYKLDLENIHNKTFDFSKKSFHFNGPGKLTKALSITKEHNNISFSGDTFWIEDWNLQISESAIKITPRIGIDYAKEDALLPYRFVLDLPNL